MGATPFSSGDPVADRRAEFAETLAGQGDPAGAAEVLCGALERVPGWVAGWYRLGEFHERAGAAEAAAASYARALEADPADALGAGLRLDLLRVSPLAETLPPAFVELLFDQYALRFEASLVGKLAYRGPALIMEQLGAAGFAGAARALDLGCGTGLMGDVLRPYCAVLDGVDLSGAMLRQARAKGVYDRLEQADIAALGLSPRGYELIVAADVFAYLGALERVIAWCAGSLVPGGHLAFTVEAGEAPLTLKDSRRFAHSPAYLEDLLATAGFAAARIEACVVRQDRGQNIASLCVVACAPVAQRDREGDGEAALLV